MDAVVTAFMGSLPALHMVPGENHLVRHQLGANAIHHRRNSQSGLYIIGELGLPASTTRICLTSG